jgi:DNA-binding NtrC family response regulator
MVMPVMNGKETFLKLKELDKDCKIIVTTGYSNSEELTEMHGLGLSAEIRKPYNMPDISKILNKVLGKN